MASFKEAMTRMEEERLLMDQQAAERRDRLMRSEGIAGIITAYSHMGVTTLSAHGPDLQGAVSLFAMSDGTIRWKRAGA